MTAVRSYRSNARLSVFRQPTPGRAADDSHSQRASALAARSAKDSAEPSSPPSNASDDRVAQPNPREDTPGLIQLPTSTAPSLAEAASIDRDKSAAQTRDGLEWRPFPVAVLPELVGRFISEGAAALGCDQTYIALPLLAMFGSCVGTTSRIRIRTDWCEYPIIWGLTIGRSGTTKSPAMDLAMSALREHEKRVIREHDAVMRAYRDQVGDMDDNAHTNRPAPLTPPPPCIRLTVDDTTLPALASILSENPRGVLLARDEMAGWLGNLNRSGKGVDAARWLELFRGGKLSVDRKTKPKVTHVPRAALSLYGTIQPGALKRVLTQDFFDNGLAARLLLAMPPSPPKVWREAEVSPAASQAITIIVERLLELRHARDDSGDLKPVDVCMTPGAKTAFIEFYNEHGREQDDAESDELVAAFAKLEAYAARLSLIVHQVRRALEDPHAGNEVDEKSVKAGVEMALWFREETQRIYAMLRENATAHSLRSRIDWIELKGGSVSVRSYQKWRKVKTSELAERELQAIVDMGRGRWEFKRGGPRGGAPSKLITLIRNGDRTNTPHGDGAQAGSGIDVPGGSHPEGRA